MDLLRSILSVREQRRGGQRADPVLIPQAVEQLRIERGLEVRDVERVVTLRMCTKVFGLVERDGLEAVGAGACVWRLVVLGVGSESADLDLACRDGAVGVNDDSEEGIGVELLVVLGRDVDAGQPAAIAGM